MQQCKDKLRNTPFTVSFYVGCCVVLRASVVAGAAWRARTSRAITCVVISAPCCTYKAACRLLFALPVPWLSAGVGADTAFLQESGRAGRDGAAAHAALFYRQSDRCPLASCAPQCDVVSLRAFYHAGCLAFPVRHTHMQGITFSARVACGFPFHGLPCLVAPLPGHKPAPG
jgi:hypothetical protein